MNPELKYELISDPVKLVSLGWEDFVRLHAQGTVFQSPDMQELFARTSGMTPVSLGVLDKATGGICGIMAGVIIREFGGLAGYFSSRTVIYGGPLIKPGCDDALDFLLRGLTEAVKKRSIFIQFRNFSDQANSRDQFIQHRYNYRDRLNLIIDTREPAPVMQHMSSSRLRQIRKGLNQGARIIVPENEGQVREFYDILRNLYRKKVKKPLPPWSFFREFYLLSREGRVGIIRLVDYKGRIIGGILSPVTPGKTIYEWYVCGLDQEFRDVYPSVLATWAAIEYALQNGIASFDFMGVGIPDREYGVREFKARFGGEMVNYGRFARINNRFFYEISETGYNILTLLKKI